MRPYSMQWTRAWADLRSTKTLEVHSLNGEHRWPDIRVYEDDVRLRTEPFTAVELELEAL